MTPEVRGLFVSPVLPWFNLDNLKAAVLKADWFVLAEIVHAARNRLPETRTADGLKAALSVVAEYSCLFR
jgi:hypothetical protein